MESTTELACYHNERLIRRQKYLNNLDCKRTVKFRNTKIIVTKVDIGPSSHGMPCENCNPQDDISYNNYKYYS